ncbi:MAG: glycosyltransferase family 39 protein [Verrucomicrobiota bacterium]
MKTLNLQKWIFAFAFILAFCIAAWRLYKPGLYYDEILFVNAAILGKTDLFIRARFFGVPLLLMDYIGALKSWLYIPVFTVFSVNPWSVRLPAIFCGLLGTLLTAGAMRRWFGVKAAWITLALTLYDPTILTHSRLDWGPNALMFCLRGALLFALAGWTKKPSAGNAWFVFVCILAGIFDKLNFIWISSGVISAVILTERKRFFLSLKRNRSQFVAWILSFSVTVFAGLRGIYISHAMFSDGNFDLSARILEAFRLFQCTFSGGGALGFIIGDGLRFHLLDGRLQAHPALGSIIGEGLRFSYFFNAPVFLCIAVSAIGLFYITTRQEFIKPWVMIVIITFITGVMFVITKGATGPHHSAVLSGLWQITIVPLLVVLVDVPRTRYLAIASVFAACSGMLISSVLVVHSLVTEVPQANWDDANWRLGHYVNQNIRDRFVITDWGMGNQVLAATRDSANFGDNWPSFVSIHDAETLVRTEADKGACCYVVRASKYANNKTAESHLRSALFEAGLEPKNIFTISSQSGEPMIYILRVAGCEPATEIELRSGMSISFSEGGEAFQNQKALSGFSKCEPDGAWTEQPVVSIKLKTPGVQSDLLLVSKIYPCLNPPVNPEQKAKIFANGTLVGEWQFNAKETVERELRIPAQVVSENSTVLLRIEISNPLIPKNLGLGEDTRNLGLKWLSLSRPAQN